MKKEGERKKRREEKRGEVEEWLFVLLPAPTVRAVNHGLLRIKAWKCPQGGIASCLPFEAVARVRGQQFAGRPPLPVLSYFQESTQQRETVPRLEAQAPRSRDRFW